MPLVRELDGVAQQVDQDLHQSMTICVDPLRHVIFNDAVVLQVHALNTLSKQIESAVNGVTQRKGFGLHIDVAGLQLRVVQHVVDDGQQVVGRLTCVVQNFEGLGVICHTLEQHVVEAKNGVHGCAEFVADSGNELFTHGRCAKQLLTFFF